MRYQPANGRNAHRITEPEEGLTVPYVDWKVVSSL